MTQASSWNPLQTSGLAARGQAIHTSESEVLSELQGRLDRVRKEYSAMRYDTAATELDALITRLGGMRHPKRQDLPAVALLLASATCLMGRIFWRRGETEAEYAAFVDAAAQFAANLADIGAHPYRGWLYTDYGIALHRIGRHSEALGILDLAIATDAAPTEAFSYRGYAYLALGDLGEAEAALRKGLERAPGDKVIMTALADTLAQRGDIDPGEVGKAYSSAAVAAYYGDDLPEAQRLLQLALAFAPTDAQALNYAVSLLRYNGKFDEAEQIVRKALEKDAHHAWALGLLAVLERDRGRLDEALRCFAGIEVSTPDLAWVPIEWARTLYAAGPDHDREALQLLAPLHDAFPGDFSVQLLEAEITARSDLGGAISLLRQIVAQDAQSAPAWRGLAWCLNEAKDYQAAADAADEILRLDRSSVAAYRLKAQALTALGKTEQAVDALRRAVRQQPGDDTILNELVNALLQDGHIEDATAELRLEIVRDPKYWQAHWYLGQIQLIQSAWGEALAELTVAKDLAPGEVGIHLGLGDALTQLDRYDEAGKAYEAALAVAPASLEAVVSRANWLQATARYAEAAQLADIAVVSNPDNPDFRLLLGMALQHADPFQPERAEAEFRHAMAAAPEDIYPPMRLATLLVEIGRREEGEGFAREVVDRQKTNVTGNGVVEALAWFYYLIGNYDEALRLLQSWNAANGDLATHFDRALALLASGREAGIAEYDRLAKVAEDRDALYRRGLFDIALRDVMAAAAENRIKSLGEPVFGILCKSLSAAGTAVENLSWMRGSFQESLLAWRSAHWQSSTAPSANQSKNWSE
jgi:tetratricopeptide (TPR) repeat protein